MSGASASAAPANLGVPNLDLPFVMAGLVPAIHVFLVLRERKTWMPATGADMTSHTDGNRN